MPDSNLAGLPDGVSVTGPIKPRYAEILSSSALELIAELHRALNGRRLEALAARAARVAEVAAGKDLDFLEETRSIREDPTWKVAPLAPGLEDRRVEMTGPTDRKMTINALNSGAKAWLADQEDANTPLWENVIEGPLNLKDALDGTIDFTSPEGKEYQLVPPEQQPTIIVRPRGWHLPEKHILVDGEITSGSLVDFALYFVANARKQLDRGKGPYFYLPKMESHREARLWNDAFTIAQDRLGIPQGTIRATCLIETLPAAFEMEEILYELRDHSSGLNAGRWDYLFSVIKTYRTRGADYIVPDRNSVTMTVPMMRAYTQLLVNTCHRRGASAIGGMAAFIPSKDEAVNQAAYEKVTADKSREAGDGFDGSWVAHPAMVETCNDVFTGVFGDRPNQIDSIPAADVTAARLLDVKSTPGDVTSAGLRSNIDIALQYLKSWLEGRGAVGIYNLMEDAATAEISRSQIWQQIRNQVQLADTGETVTKEMVLALADEVVAELPGSPSDYDDAKATFLEVAVADDYADFLTLPAYDRMP
ncbi:malate synthase A [Flexivirga caeni]|uniref:Malate synthase n=1 Tax=Flexivirga caeni TaxID=2294115 RepID=A0A3M9M4F0_9MICO|nr:malate synthase A [Flexivirga caeni]RNI20429.1 malate synthase A [Flexivirga caeni]